MLLPAFVSVVGLNGCIAPFGTIACHRSACISYSDSQDGINGRSRNTASEKETRLSINSNVAFACRGLGVGHCGQPDVEGKESACLDPRLSHAQRWVRFDVVRYIGQFPGAFFSTDGETSTQAPGETSYNRLSIRSAYCILLCGDVLFDLFRSLLAVRYSFLIGVWPIFAWEFAFVSGVFVTHDALSWDRIWDAGLDALTNEAQRSGIHRSSAVSLWPTLNLSAKPD